MGKILLIFIVLFAGFVLLSLAIAVLKALAVLAARIAISLAGAVTVGGLAAAAGESTGRFDGPSGGVLVGLLSFVLIFGAILLRAQKRASAGSLQVERQLRHGPTEPPVRIRFAEDRLEKAWSAAEQAISWRRVQLTRAGDACAKLARDPSLHLDTPAAELVSIVRSHVPPLVDHCRLVCDGAPVDEAEKAWNEVAFQLEGMGEKAFEMLHQRRSMAKENLELRSRHVESRLAALKPNESDL